MDADTGEVIVFLALIAPTGLLASVFAQAPSFLFSALWFSFVFLFTYLTIASGLLVVALHRRWKVTREIVANDVTLPALVFSTWALVAYLVNLGSWFLLTKLALWSAYLIGSEFALLKRLDRMERLHPGGKRRLSARLQRKLGAKTR